MFAIALSSSPKRLLMMHHVQIPRIDIRGLLHDIVTDHARYSSWESIAQKTHHLKAKHANFKDSGIDGGALHCANYPKQSLAFHNNGPQTPSPASL
jgi:hypothetical protein